MRRWIWLCWAFPLWAQVSFDIKPNEIGINEVIQFAIRVEGQGNVQPIFPKGFDGGDFELIDNSPSTSFSVSIVNGKRTSLRTFTYILRPKKQGNLRFPSQTISINGRTFSSPAKSIVVGEEVRNIQRPNARRDPFDQFFSKRPRRKGTNAEVFAVAEVPKSSFFVGEPIPFEVNVYWSPGVSISNNGSSMDAPDFSDFWSEEIESQETQGTRLRDNKRYEYFSVDRRRLFANKTGSVTIQPANFVLRVAVGGGFFADWQTVKRKTNPVILDIKPLPEAGKPVDFTGAVGKFSIKASLDKPQIKVGESVSLKIEIAGDGNFIALNDLGLEDLGSDIEIFEGGAPTISKQKGRIANKTWIYALVPRSAGTIDIPVPQLAYFDPAQNAYRRTKAQSFSLDVQPGEGLAPSLTTGSALNPLLLAEQNLNFIKVDPLRLGAVGSPLQPRLLAYIVGGFVVLNLLLYVWMFTRRRSRDRKAALRPKYAYNHFKRTLTGLRSGKLEESTFYGALADAVRNYFGDKWNRPGHGLSLDLIAAGLAKAQVDQELMKEIEAVVEACEWARFAPQAQYSREQWLDRAQQAIAKTDKELA